MILYYLLVLTLPLVSHPILEYQIGGFSVEKYLGLACLVFAICTIPFRRTLPNFFGTTQARMFLMLYILLGISYFTKGWDIAPIGVFLIYTSHLVFLIITLLLVDSLPRLRWSCLAAIASLGVAALYALREWQGGSQLYGAGYRPGYVTGDPNYYTASAILCLPLALHFAQEKRPAWQRFFCIGVILVALAAVMVASSRGGFFGLVAAALVYIWQSPKRMRNLTVIVMVGAVFVLVSPASPLDRLLNPSTGDIEAQEIRLALWQGGLEMVRAQPLTGVGLGTFKERILKYAPPGFDAQFLAHNTYLEMAAEAGIPALLAFLGLFFFTWVNLRRIRRATKESGPPLVYHVAGAIQAGTAGFAVAIFFLSAVFLKLFWFVLFISACLARLKDSVASVPSNESEILEPASDSYLIAKH